MEFKKLYQELVNSTEMIMGLLADISQDEAQIKPNPESWSILEVISHLYDEEREDFREHLDWLQGLSDANWETTYTSQFGSMKAGDMFTSWVAHDNLHIRQLTELRRNKIERITKPYDIQYAGDW
jgi:hypothetical protein